MRAYDVQQVEAHWRERWEHAGCHRAPRRPGAAKWFVHDAAPFPNGPLHMGHVRTYVLGDVTARYQRLRGKAVLYHTGFDAFGLPIELEAIRRGLTPRELVERSARTMRQQLERLGISYDWSMVPNTCDPACYRWTQWLFLEMFEAGLVYRCAAPLNWCPRCETTLSRLQVEDGTCWRCHGDVETRNLPQWFVAVSRYGPRLSESLKGLDWLVSRQRSWGTPMPIVHCASCGPVPVPDGDLPVLLPDDLDWASGSGALARCDAFLATDCPRCGRPARRESDTLDCFFDDIWCFLQALALRGDPPGLSRRNFDGWLPVDRCQSGIDAVQYFHLYRFLGQFLAERGVLDDPELIRSYLGSDLVLAGGRKMSKHLGNAVSPQAILDDQGADVLRVAMLWAGGPQRAIDWHAGLLERAEALLAATYALTERCAPHCREATGAAASRAGTAVETASRRCAREVARFIEQYRPNAALERLADLLKRAERFADRRVPTGRLTPDEAGALRATLMAYLVALAPFAPHLAEECWRRMNCAGLVCQAVWPDS